MAMLGFRLLGLVSILAGACGLRKRRNGPKASTKIIAGVPVLNYQLTKAQQGGTQASAEQDWVVVMQPGTVDSVIDSMCQTAGPACGMVGHPASGGMPFLRLRGTEEDLGRALKGVGSAAKFVEPDSPVSKIPEIDAKDDEVSPTRSWTWGLERIYAPERVATGQGAHMYVLDTGVRVSHLDFGGRAVPALDVTSGTTVECGDDLACAPDVDGHGTHCAGTIGGAKWGVAPATSIYSAKVIGDEGSGQWSWIYGALDWVASKGNRPAIASMSLGGRTRIMSVRDSIDSAVAAGVTVVVAAGNENDDACDFSPSYVPSAITVGSTDSRDDRSWFSNYGTCTNIWAPGTNVQSASNGGDDWSKTLSGTSMACPHVAGAAALLLEGDPQLSPAAIRSGLLDRAQQHFIADLEEGDVNLFLYVGAGPTPSTTTPPPTPAGPCGSDATGPSDSGDCRCNDPLKCYEDGEKSCTYSATAGRGWRNDWFYSLNCTGCACVIETTPPPTPAPSCPLWSTGPSESGNCRCINPAKCFENGTRGCTYSATAEKGWMNDWFFLYDCTGCACIEP